MRNVSTIDEALDVPTRDYVDQKIIVSTTQPTDPACEIWINPT